MRMRATLAPMAAIAAVLLLPGCSSSGNRWNWQFWRRHDDMAAASSSGPQLPSAGANSSAPAVGAAPGTGPNLASPYSSSGPQYPTNAYPGQSTGYNDPAGAGATAAATGGAYAAQPAAGGNAAPQAPAYAAQNGPYGGAGATGQAYAGQPAAGQPYAGQSNGDQATTGASAYTAQSGPYEATPSQGGQPPAYTNTATDSYSTPDGGYRTATASSGNPYRNVSVESTTATDSSQPGENRDGTTASQTEASAADSYGAAASEAAAGGTATAGDDRYQPGNTGYQPGNTGYTPPGVAPYQMPSQPNVVSTPRRDPYYRPGGTSDYLPSSSPAANPTDRFAPSSAGAAGSDPYAPPGGYQTAPNQ